MQEIPFLLWPLLLYLGRARLGSAQHRHVLTYHGLALRVYRNHAHWETGPPTLPCKISAALCSLVFSLQALGVFCICVIKWKSCPQPRPSLCPCIPLWCCLKPWVSLGGPAGMGCRAGPSAALGRRYPAFKCRRINTFLPLPGSSAAAGRTHHVLGAQPPLEGLSHLLNPSPVAFASLS